MAEPLTKRRKSNGQPYSRPDGIDDEIDALMELPRSTIRERLVVRSRAEPGYIPSECLVHLIRRTRLDNDQTYFGELYAIVLDRIDKALPRPDQTGGSAGTTSALLEQVRDRVRDLFIELLIEDRAEGTDALDIFECRFDYAIAKRRASAWEATNLKARRTQTLPDEEPAGNENDDDRNVGAMLSTICSDPNSRMRLRTMIDGLTDNDRRIMQMIIEGYSIDSKQPGEITISGLLGCDEKTIRNRRNAFVAEMKRRLQLEGML